MENELNIREQITRIDRAMAEYHKLAAEEDKLRAESLKLQAEANKLRVDRWLAPVIVIFGGLGSLIAAYSAVTALLRHVGG